MISTTFQVNGEYLSCSINYNYHVTNYDELTINFIKNIIKRDFPIEKVFIWVTDATRDYEQKSFTVQSFLVEYCNPSQAAETLKYAERLNI